jgi:bifunctional DNA-binding transcriptional regulator/antitoxin component of YhaV-PrlF toxin-antitoxin module
MRKQLGIAPGSAVVIEDRDGELSIRPAAILEIATYSDAQIAEWDTADTLSAKERENILKRLLAR